MPSDGIPAANSLFVASIAKGFRVLECIADADHPLRITEIAACTGFDRSLVQRLTNTLHTLGYRPGTRATGGTRWQSHCWTSAIDTCVVNR